MTSGDSSVTNSGNKGALEELAIRRCRNNSSWGTMRAGDRAGFSFSTVIPTGVDSLDENATWAHVKSNRRKRIKSMETASLGARPRALLCSLLLSDHPIENIHRTRAPPGKKERERERNRVTSRECDLSPRIKDDVAQNYKRHAVPSVDRIRRQERRETSSLPRHRVKNTERSSTSARPFNRDVAST